MKSENIQILKKALSELELQANEDAISRLIKFHDHLMTQSLLYNLTGHKDENTSHRHNLLNSLAALPAMKTQSHLEIADIGTGAGLPGIPWSILMPETKFYLVDSKKKKINFLKEVVNLLALPNVILLRTNAFEIKQRFETLVFQAFGKIPKIIQVINACMKNSGQAYLFAANTSKIKPELDSFTDFTYEIRPFEVPQLPDYERNLICITKKLSTK